MIHALDVALKRIHFNIPEEMLRLVFEQQHSELTKSPSLDNNIMGDVIHHHVLTDCNVRGGKMSEVTLELDWALNTPEEPFSLFEIPAQAREGRDIIECGIVSRKVANAFFGHVADTEVWPTYKSYIDQTPISYAPSINNAMIAMLEAKTGMGASYHDPIAVLMGNNMIKLRPGPNVFVNWVVSVRLAYDKSFTNLNGAALDHFADICVLAVKRYIYTKLAFKVDRGMIQFGAELPVVKDLLQRWSELQQEYVEKCTTFANATFLDIHRIEGLFKHSI